MVPDKKCRFDAVFISDLHLGNKFVDRILLKQFLDLIKSETATLYLTGDVFDAWRHCQPVDYLDMFDGFRQIVYIRGNHDGIFAEQQNPLPAAAIDSHKLCWNGKNGMVTHAHLFDKHFDKDSWWARFADATIYRVSRLLGCDLKAKIGRLGNLYSCQIENACTQIGQLFELDFMVIGHTHYGGERNLNGIRLFNLGSWLTTPYALFRTGDSYCFCSIDKNTMLPEQNKFKSF